MPIRDFKCRACGNFDEDRYLPKWNSPDPLCPVCGGEQEQLVGRFGVVFSGPLSAKYMDSKREYAHLEGYWAYKRKSSISGHPEPVFIDSWQAARDFNKAEGLSAPGEVPKNSTISADGKRILSDGFPGQWRGGMPAVPSGVWKMNKSLTALNGKDPAPVASGPPCEAKVVDAKLMETFAAEAGKP